MANIVVELLISLAKCLWFCLEAFVLMLLPFLKKRKDVAGEIVLVTGAGSGIGRLLALKFAKLGSVLVLWDIDSDSVEATEREIRELGAKASSYKVDCSSRDAVYKNAEMVKEEVGDVSILVNNAGIVTGKKFLQCPDNLVEKTMQVNAMAHFWTVKAFLPSMLNKNHGHIVSIASSAGLIGVTGLSDYCASKFAAVGFDEALRFEIGAMGKDGVHTTVVCPFFIETGMFEGVTYRMPWLLKALKPDDCADKIVDAVRTNQVMLYMPRLLYVLIGVKGLLPVKVQKEIVEVCGVNQSMDHFVGRQKKKL
ncbi:epidermal retinol dehydrogenase 2-like [Ptychodera flava]|uniref:epidermal retinol dehydrogenase 2-like n=1 Tax=Ptychodera flava TaxID=63121 RepID=UPI00396A9A0D